MASRSRSALPSAPLPEEKRPSAILARTRALIAEPSTWTSGAFARDKYHNSTDPVGFDAVCWCTLGAARRARSEIQAPYEANRLSLQHLNTACTDLHGPDQAVASINDHLGHKEALALVDRAIFLAQCREESLCQD